ncbi:hypothetical protein PINS_up004238 [Pythium insidiosum]|nr:hypothetical protein PINS_up004238 [Pythium insidiosum]
MPTVSIYYNMYLVAPHRGSLGPFVRVAIFHWVQTSNPTLVDSRVDSPAFMSKLMPRVRRATLACLHLFAIPICSAVLRIVKPSDTTSNESINENGYAWKFDSDVATEKARSLVVVS